ncbi:MAG: HAMP domain-containing sensor histidine kinase [Elusimicrobiota bacterium]
MQAKQFTFMAVAMAGGLAVGYILGRRRRFRMAAALADEERLAWLQRLSTIGQMMSGVVHEVRTPLNTVILTVEHAQSILDRGGDPRPQLNAVTREADRAVTILSDILDFAKPAPLDLKPLEIKPLLTGVVEDLKIRFTERGVSIGIESPDSLRVLASERHIQQVLTILLINALDAMPFGGRLNLRVESRRSLARISVVDTGIGIEPAKLKGLFEPFATGRAESGGTGLGLNVARWIMNKHGGDVAIASPGLGKGTTVTLTLKLA